MLNETEIGSPKAGYLSKREREVLALTSRGMTNRDVAAQLNVSVHAVKFHLASSYRKLGVSNRTEAAVAYLRGELELADVTEQGIGGNG